MNWIQKNFNKIIYAAFLVPIITVAVVSISHVTKWYTISNPQSWSIYLSVGIEIAALSALAAIAAKMGKKVYFPFILVTILQFLGNIYFAYSFIDLNSKSFKDWVDMVDPIVSFLGVESGDVVGHKRFLALLSGGLLPIISLSFLHMLVKFEEEEKNKKDFDVDLQKIDVEELSKKAGRVEAQITDNPYVPTKEDLENLEKMLSKFTKNKVVSDTILTESVELTEPLSTIEKIQDEPVISDTVVSIPETTLEEPSIPVENQKPGKRVLSYSKRNA